MANTLAYYDMATITAVKIFIVQAPGLKITKRTTKGKFYKPLTDNLERLWQAMLLVDYPRQGILTEGQGSVQLSSVYYLVQISYF